MLRCTAVRSALTAVLVSLLATAASAEVRPGDLVTKAKADAVADLVSPGIRWCLQHGMQGASSRPTRARRPASPRSSSPSRT
jgi:hypothetical protein